MPFHSFNPRSYKRSDEICVVKEENSQLSIHAPTRGATKILVPVKATTFFQSTLLQEERPVPEYGNGQNVTFNPRSYKRSDYRTGQHLPRPSAFNPRSYKRSDAKILSLNVLFFIFQSTLLQEERRKSGRDYEQTKIFQSTLLQEERQYCLKKSTTFSGFQSTLLQEERHST